MDFTIKDVAKKANVSIATVSRVINKLPVHKKETEENVLRIIKELGYHPNLLARNLVGKKINTIGVLIPNLSSLVTTEILKGVEESAHKNNHSIIICNTDRRGLRTMEYLDVLRSKQVDGLIIVSEKITKEYVEMINDTKMQVVLISTYYDNNMTFIKIDDEKASYDATNYLISKGHSNIAMIAGSKKDYIAGTLRVKGYLRALKENKITFRKENLVYGNFRFDSGKSCFEDLIKKSPDITAIFCASDEMAIGVLSKAYKLGIKIPDQISIIGFDGTDLSLMTIPPLTTVNQFFYEMGYQGFNMLIEKVNGVDVKSYFYMHQILERETVRNIQI